MKGNVPVAGLTVPVDIKNKRKITLPILIYDGLIFAHQNNQATYQKLTPDNLKLQNLSHRALFKFLIKSQCNYLRK